MGFGRRALPPEPLREVFDAQGAFLRIGLNKETKRPNRVQNRVQIIGFTSKRELLGDNPKPSAHYPLTVCFQKRLGFRVQGERTVKDRYRLVRRAYGIYYALDKETGKKESLFTS